MIREAKHGELDAWPSAEGADRKFILEEYGHVVGFVALSVKEHAFGKTCWAHDIAHWGKEPGGLLLLMRKAREEAKSLGFSEIVVNAQDDKLKDVLARHGFEIITYVLKGNI